VYSLHSIENDTSSHSDTLPWSEAGLWKMRNTPQPRQLLSCRLVFGDSIATTASRGVDVEDQSDTHPAFWIAIIEHR
jgi:hypothetical protein